MKDRSLDFLLQIKAWLTPLIEDRLLFAKMWAVGKPCGRNEIWFVSQNSSMEESAVLVFEGAETRSGRPLICYTLYHGGTQLEQKPLCFCHREMWREYPSRGITAWEEAELFDQNAFFSFLHGLFARHPVTLLYQKEGEKDEAFPE